jgi:hypothetical protein
MQMIFQNDIAVHNKPLLLLQEPPRFHGYIGSLNAGENGNPVYYRTGSEVRQRTSDELVTGSAISFTRR